MPKARVVWYDKKMKARLKNWDYQLPKNWTPKTDEEWRWYLERRINYDNLGGLEIQQVKRFLPHLKIDEGKRLLFEAYFKWYK